MVELVEFLVTHVVENKAAVRVTEAEDGVISVSVDKADIVLYNMK